MGDFMNIREKRKWQHLEHSRITGNGPLNTGFQNIHLVHQALSSVDLEEVNCSTTILNKVCRFPLIINAMTGGAKGLEKFNQEFAIAARECGIGLAVGSQTAAINNPETRYTFEVVRKYNPDGLILANVSALVNPQHALEAVEMIGADGLQLHLNIAQELAMVEGDRKFKGTMENIIFIKEQLKVPVIIKEVGFGLSYETVHKLYNHGIKYFDTGGAGGTNFAAIEKERNSTFTNEHLIDWGIPTVTSLIEALNVAPDIEVFATGGIRSAKDILISLALGATSVGIATPALNQIYDQDAEALIYYLENIFTQVRELMVLIDANNLEAVRKTPLIISGNVKEWLEQRGINTKKYGLKNLR